MGHKLCGCKHNCRHYECVLVLMCAGWVCQLDNRKVQLVCVWLQSPTSRRVGGAYSAVSMPHSNLMRVAASNSYLSDLCWGFA